MGLFDRVLGKDHDSDEKSDRREKQVANFSDVSSGSSSTAPAPQAASAAAPADRQYTVAAGDSLSAIAKREYGDASKWHAIYDANREQISNPDLIHPGQKLRLPANP